MDGLFVPNAVVTVCPGFLSAVLCCLISEFMSARVIT